MMYLDINKLQIKMAETGVSKKKLKEQLNWYTSDIKAVFNGSRNVRFSTIGKIANICHCDVKDIVSFKE